MNPQPAADPPPPPEELDVAQVAAMLDDDPALTPLDVREDWEREIAAIKRSEPLTGARVTELLETGDRDAALVFVCHHGIRSFQAAEFFASHGFRRVYSMRGGLDAWAASIEPGMATY